MTDNDNPYAPPLADCRLEAPAGDSGIWRQDDFLVAPRHGQLPLRCIATNLPAQGYDPHALMGLDPPLPIPLSESYLQFVRTQARLALSLSALGVLLTLLLPIALTIARVLPGGVRFLGKPDWPEFLTVGIGALLLIAGLTWGRGVTLLLYVHHATDSHVWIYGVHPDYLAQLPEWPYERH